jgi:hypothetical protein
MALAVISGTMRADAKFPTQTLARRARHWAGLLADAERAPVGVAAQPAPGRHGLDLFSDMLPAFGDARCMNCHGGVDPETGDNHPGGPVPGFHMGDGGVSSGSEACSECHTESAEWRLAPREMSFVGKDAAALCSEVKQMTGDGSGSLDTLERHLEGDPRIHLGLEGKRGIADATPEPPPITEEAFYQAAANWIADLARCSTGSWSGTVTYDSISTSTSEETTNSSCCGGRPTTLKSTVAHTLNQHQVWTIKDGTETALGAGVSQFQTTFDASWTESRTNVTTQTGWAVCHDKGTPQVTTSSTDRRAGTAQASGTAMLIVRQFIDPTTPDPGPVSIGADTQGVSSTGHASATPARQSSTSPTSRSIRTTPTTSPGLRRKPCRSSTG